MIDRTVQIFNQFYDVKLEVGADQYEIVLSFFKGKTTSERTAQAYAENLFRISQQLNIDVLTLLDTFEGDDGLRVTLTMAYYLNSFSDKTVMYGINSVIQPNENVARNVLQ